MLFYHYREEQTLAKFLELDMSSDEVMSTGSSAATDESVQDTSTKSTDIPNSPRSISRETDSSLSIAKDIDFLQSPGSNVSEEIQEIEISPRSNISVTTSFSSEIDYSFRHNSNNSKRFFNSSFIATCKEERNRIKCAHISNEHVRLTEVLDALEPQQIMDILKYRLKKKDSKSIVALSVLLPRATYPPIEHAHCARCHRKFSPHEHSNCLVRHPNASVIKVSQDKQGADFLCRSCNKQFRLNHMYFYNESVNSYLSGFCFNGKHTVSPKDVCFHGAVKSCEENGCVELYV